MRRSKNTVDNMVKRAARLWGISDWTIQWKYGDVPHEAENEPKYWTEKRALLRFDRHVVNTCDRKRLLYLCVHELGHCVIYPIWRSMTDFADNYVKSAKERAAYEDVVNSAENIVLDHIIREVMGIR